MKDSNGIEIKVGDILLVEGVFDIETTYLYRVNDLPDYKMSVCYPDEINDISINYIPEMLKDGGKITVKTKEQVDLLVAAFNLN